MDHRCGIALGSNLGDRLTQLRAARRAILALPCIRIPWVQSAVYETEPIDCPPGSPAFLNAVIEVGITISPVQFLLETQAIEAALGRQRSGIRNEARPVDIDLLYCGEERFATERLALPHPRLTERLFVVRPLSDIRPDLLLLGQRKSIAELHTQLSDSSEQVCSFAREW